MSRIEGALWKHAERFAWPRRPSGYGDPALVPTRWRAAWAWTWPGSRPWSWPKKETRSPNPEAVDGRPQLLVDRRPGGTVIPALTG